MGNFCGAPVKTPSPSTARASSEGTSRTSSNFGQSTGSTVASFVDEAPYPKGQILKTPSLRIFTFAELKSTTKNFKPETILGEGGFGRVYKGWVNEKTLNPTKCGLGMVIAVKKLDSESVQGLEEWQSEVNFLGRISHPNLVKLLGYCWEDTELLLVYEFMAKGSLDNHLFSRGAATESLPWRLRLKIVLGAARGLAFLHASEKQVIYGDFKASNILLDSNYNAKLSDFGLAKNGPTGGDSHVTTRVMGTYGYAAPEYVATGHLYVKSDVYGFGVVLLEMLSGQRALDLNRPSGQQNLVNWAKPFLSDRKRLARVMDPQLEAKYPPKAALQAAQLTLRCLAGNPKSRPLMQEAVKILENVDALSRPMEPRDKPPRSSKDAKLDVNGPGAWPSNQK